MRDQDRPDTGVLGSRSVPSADATGTFRAVAAAERHACGLRTTGRIVCWGDNENGELDAPAGSDFVAISGVHDHTCALTSAGELECWGSAAGGATGPALKIANQSRLRSVTTPTTISASTPRARSARPRRFARAFNSP